jgi:hypothetical protein
MVGGAKVGRHNTPQHNTTKRIILQCGSPPHVSHYERRAVASNAGVHSAAACSHGSRVWLFKALLLADPPPTPYKVLELVVLWNKRRLFWKVDGVQPPVLSRRVGRVDTPLIDPPPGEARK